MTIGVKFCGGCNPRYNRKEYLELIKKHNSDKEFEIADEDNKYDFLLVIGGCPSCCASYNQYDFDNLVKVWEPSEDFDLFP